MKLEKFKAVRNWTKKYWNKIPKTLQYGIYTVVGMIVGAFLTVILVDIPTPHTPGSQSDWIAFFGNISGGLIGAFVAFYIARVQAEKETERMRTEMEREKEEARQQRDLKVIEERYRHLYEPAYRLLEDFHHRYHAHNFVNLTRGSIEQFIAVIAENISYADVELDLVFRELRWALAVGFSDDVNRKNMDIQYRYIGELITNTFHELRNKLNYPSLVYGDLEGRTNLYAELESRYFPDGYETYQTNNS